MPRLSTSSLVAQQLRQAAEGPPPPLNAFMDRTISSWVGMNTEAWRAVFDFSSDAPLFLWLDTEAQRIALLLVACAIEQ